MKKNKELTNDEIAIEIYRRMYKQSQPKANIDKIIKSGEGKKPNWFMKYYLPQEIQEKIINEVLDENKVEGFKRGRFFTEIMLGSSPTSSIEAWKKENKK